MHQHNHQHGHDHSHHDHARSGNKKGLRIALIITVGIMILEFVGGLLTNSLALLSDSGHMLSDASALLLSLVALWFATKPSSPNKTYGFYRFEILAALLNGVALFVIAGFIVWEAIQRFNDPPTVASGSMMLIAVIGLLANLLSAWFLMRTGDVKNNVNLRSAYLHVIGDALGSVGAIVAGIVMIAFGWYIADPIISILVSILILKSAWRIIQNTVHILMEGVPASVHPEAVTKSLLSITGVTGIHDLHIWTITSNFDSLSCHVVIADDIDSFDVLQQAIDLLDTQFHIEHATIQIENTAIVHKKNKV
ncbi:zinc transporter ZitB [Paenibacillus glucanolyticus]|uniref:Zinc transporter ZitB n=1 Tax=Paenibacillus glucanolyticus TaxID=59843 RepID=A0A163M2H3_9BACL|nr:cation diffusion facilitator family transporter [Paenibacillus glucanolyticus]KZS48687.1 zinc transporter ZitB [Paenibacillus glucanolyticus]